MKKLRTAAQVMLFLFLLAVVVVAYRCSNPVIKGTVVDEDTGKPIPAGHVTARSCSFGDSVSSVAKMTHDRAITDVHGKFVVKPSYGHQWDLFVWSPGYYPCIQDGRDFKGVVRLKKAKNSAVANVDWDGWVDTRRSARSGKQLQESLWTYYTVNNLW